MKRKAGILTLAKASEVVEIAISAKSVFGFNVSEWGIMLMTPTDRCVFKEFEDMNGERVVRFRIGIHRFTVKRSGRTVAIIKPKNAPRMWIRGTIWEF